MRDDELDRVGEMRPDQVEPHDPAEPTVFTRHKEHLMSSINPADLQTHLEAQHEMPDIYPRLAYNDERAAVEYLERVFGLEEIREARADFGDSLLAWLRVGTGVLMVGHANEEIHQISSPEQVGRTTVQVMVHVRDVESHYENAVAQGATVTMPLQDAFYGERRYEATDLEGHRWHFGETFANIAARGGAVPDNPTGGLPSDD